jgi:integrin alpha FG-GAP repeat containing protein 1
MWLQDFFQIPISAIFPSQPGLSPAQLLVSDTTFSPYIPLSLKLGDVNLDGFPDLLVIVAPPGSPHDRVPKLIYSVPCAKGVVGCANDNIGKRGFSVATKGTDALDQVKDARGVSFLDLDEDVSCVHR